MLRVLALYNDTLTMDFNFIQKDLFWLSVSGGTWR